MNKYPEHFFLVISMADTWLSMLLNPVHLAMCIYLEDFLLYGRVMKASSQFMCMHPSLNQFM